MRGLAERLVHPEATSEDPNAAFALTVARALHHYGMPADRLEATLEAVSARLGTEARFFCTPTAIFAAFGTPPAQQTFMVRTDAGALDLGRLAELDAVVTRVATGELTVAEGEWQLAQTLRAKPRSSGPLRAFAHSALAGSFAVLLGGSGPEAAVAALAGLVVAGLEAGAARAASVARLVLPLAAFFAAATATVAATYFAPLSIEVATIAGIIMLLPGLSLTVGMNEIATGHLISGVARLSGALVAFLLIGFGVALGGELAARLPGIIHRAAVDDPDRWTLAVALGTAALAMPVILRARLRDLPVVAGASALAFIASRAGALTLGPELGGCLGALALGLAGNAYARFLGGPAAVAIVPGILLLVPGAIGFRSITSFLASDTLAAVDTAFHVSLVAVTLVSGLLVANLTLPPRKPL